MAKNKLIIPLLILVLMVVALYWQFFLLGKIPLPADLLVGAYYPWLDYKWGYTVGVPVKNPLISDVFSQFFVWKYLSLDLLKSGKLPLWNSFSFSGTPLLATYHSAVLQPFNFLLLLPNYAGWGLYIFGQTVMAAVGMYLLLAFYGINRPLSRISGSIIFSLSGLMTTWLEFGTGVWAVAMLPWVIWSVESFMKFAGYRYLVLLAFSFTTLYLSGNAQITQYASILFLAYIVFKIFFGQLSKIKLLLLLGGWSLSLGLSAIQLLPAIDHMNSTIRTTDIPVLGAEHDGLNDWFEMVRLFAPDFFGNPASYNFFGKGSYHEQASFLGVLTIPLIAALIFIKKKPKNIYFWLGVFLSTIFLAYKNPLTVWIYSFKVPLLTYSNASRILFLTSLSAGILAAFSMEQLQPEKKSTRRFIYSCAALLVIVLALMGWAGLIGSRVDPRWLISARNLIIPAGILFLCVILLWKVKNRFLVGLIIVTLLYLDLGRYFLKYNPFVSVSLVFPTTQVIDFLQKQPQPFRIARVDPEALPPNTWTAYGIESVEGYDPMVTGNYARFMNLANGKLYQDGVNRYVETRLFPSKFLDTLNVKYVLAVKRDEKGSTGGSIINQQLLSYGYKVAFEDKSTVVLENPFVKERVFSVTRLTAVRQREDLITRIQSKDFDPTVEAVVVADKNTPEVGLGSRTLINDNRAGQISISAISERNSFLVVSVPYSKDWILLGDGKPADLYEVDGALMGILVAPGKHEYLLTYWPSSFDLGLKVSAFSAIVVAIISLYSLRRKRW